MASVSSWVTPTKINNPVRSMAPTTCPPTSTRAEDTR